jgi:acyl-CoA reductase-like NAD-dependent aldehyde dehydrogenase
VKEAAVRLHQESEQAEGRRREQEERHAEQDRLRREQAARCDELIRIFLRAMRAAGNPGAAVLAGGERPAGAGSFFVPTVLTVEDPDAAILLDEVFGPIAPILAFDDEADAVRLANRTPDGLAAYVCSSDLKRALRVAEALEAGMVGINRECCPMPPRRSVG